MIITGPNGGIPINTETRTGIVETPTVVGETSILMDVVVADLDTGIPYTVFAYSSRTAAMATFEAELSVIANKFVIGEILTKSGAIDITTDSASGYTRLSVENTIQTDLPIVIEIEKR